MGGPKLASHRPAGTAFPSLNAPLGPPSRPPMVVVHVPHAATAIPEDMRGDFLLTDEELQRKSGR